MTQEGRRGNIAVRLTVFPKVLKRLMQAGKAWEIAKGSRFLKLF
jgi:hypothetical protein